MIGPTITTNTSAYIYYESGGALPDLTLTSVIWGHPCRALCLTDEKMEENRVSYMHKVKQQARFIHSLIQYLLNISTMGPGTVLGSGDLATSKTKPLRSLKDLTFWEGDR